MIKKSGRKKKDMLKMAHGKVFKKDRNLGVVTGQKLGSKLAILGNNKKKIV